MRCSYKSQWIAFGSLTVIFLMIAASLFIAGGIVYHNDRHARNTHELNTCEVIASNYYQTICRGGGRYGRTFVCFVPVWMVTYSTVEEIRIDATIQQSGLRTTAAAQDRLDERQIGMSYSCWCSVIDPSTARWNEPSTFVGMMLLICAGIASVVGFVGIFFSYRAYKNL